MYNSLFGAITLFLSLFTLTLATADHAANSKLTVRQEPAQQPLIECAAYERIANLSTIGSNSTYRSAFYSRSTTGSMYDNRMFSEAIAALPALTANQQLNEQCGNKTTIAFEGAMSNYSNPDNRIVAQFSGIVPEGIKAGPEVVVIVGGIVLLFGGVWSFMP